jgi:hypothetical protein
MKGRDEPPTSERNSAMNYLLLIYSDEKVQSSLSKEGMEAMMDNYNAYTDALQKAGVMVDGNALHFTSAATTVRVQSGERIITHGPFAETKEQLGGYYLLNCQNLDQALEWAARCPGASGGSIEVRPVVDFSQAQ